MLRKNYLKILIGVVAVVLLIKLISIVLIEPWIGKKIVSVLSEKFKDYTPEIKNVHVSFLKAGIELDQFSLIKKSEISDTGHLEVKIDFIKIEGIHLSRFLFKREINIREVTISNSSIFGEILFPKKGSAPIVSKSTVQIEKIFFDQIDLAVKNTSNATALSVKEGGLTVYDLQIGKQDTLSADILKQFDFKAEQLVSVSADSMYTYHLAEVVCSSTSKSLLANSFSIHPNYSEYHFASRHKFQIDRIEADLSFLNIQDFSASGFLKSGNLVSSCLEIGKMDLKVFRDKRKPFQHIIKPTFQNMISNYHALINIDSIVLLSGNITYREHVVKANEAGSIRFEKIHAKIYHITNDTIYKKQKAYFKLNANAMLMGKGKISIQLKARIFDHQNTFSVTGALGAIEANELNPMLEKNAFVFVTSGQIESMNFNFTANDNKASGTMTMLYHGLDIAVKNKRTDDTTSIKERIISIIANLKVINSNPTPKEAVRVGMIEYKRDPERFLISYCSKSILSGIKSSIVKAPKK